MSEFIYLDTETTGLYNDDEIVELAIIDDNNNVLINTLIKPAQKKSWSQAQRIHGISPQMVADAPNLLDISDHIKEVVKDKNLIIYNKDFDVSFFTDELDTAASIQCCMIAFSDHQKIWSDYHQSYKWFKLVEAASICDHIWSSEAHRALADTQATKAVWNYLQKHLQNS